MKQYEAEQIAEAHVRNTVRFRMSMWLAFFPVLGVVLYLVFSSGYHAPVHHAPPVFSCASQRADDAVLGDGGAIAPLCGETPNPPVPQEGG